MAGRGPAPKPEHLRQRKNRKVGRAQLVTMLPPSSGAVPVIPNPDGRQWHDLTVSSWQNAWASPMASQWIETDWDALGRLALLWDEFYKKPEANGLKEIRLQSALFGLSPLDRSRLQWEVNRADVAEKQQAQRQVRKTGTHDPRAAFMAVAKS